MKKKLQSWLSVLCLCAGCFSGFAGCGSKATGQGGTGTPSLTKKPETTITPIRTESPEEVRNLNGMQIIIGDTHSPEVTPVPENVQEQVIQQFRDEAMQKYNFTI